MNNAHMMPFEEISRVIANTRIQDNLGLLELHAPRTSAHIRPGQFIHMQIPHAKEHILRRPFSVYKAAADLGTITILYQVVGAGSALLQEVAPETEMSILAPLGNTWPLISGKTLLVGGGVGAAPLFMLAQTLVEQKRDLDVVLGARNAEMLITKQSYASLGVSPIIATDDGSEGYHGFASEPVKELLSSNTYDAIYCCGPEPFMRVIADIAKQAHTQCFISTEKRMACGIGACLSCVVDTYEGKKRSCIHGPIFDSKEIFL